MLSRPLQLLLCSLFALAVVALAWPARAQGLGELIAEAVASNPAVTGQQAQVEAAEAALGGAKWQFFPTPSASLETARTRDTDRLYQGDNRVATVKLQQPLWTGGRLSAGLAKAQASLAANATALEEIRQQLALRVVQSYGDWLTAHLRMLVSERSLVKHRQLRELVTRRIAEGASAESDLTLAVARHEALAAEVAANAAQRDVALARLAQVLGREVETRELAARASAPFAVEGKSRELVEQALAVSPALEKARAQSQMQEAAIDERRADLSPEVYVRLERQVGNYNFPNGPPENRLFFGVNTRFGAGLSSLSGIEAARAQHRASLSELETQSRAVGEQVLADHAVASTAEGRQRAQQAALDAAREVALSYDRQFLAGRKSWLDVMNAARELAQAESQLAELLSTRVVVSWRLAILTRGVAEVIRPVSREVSRSIP